jgi:hemoglobin
MVLRRNSSGSAAADPPLGGVAAAAGQAAPATTTTTTAMAAALRTPLRYGMQPAAQTPDAPRTVFERLGGPEPFWRIARAFYARIDRHPQLRPMFPEDLEEPIRNQAEFLIQYFGGPQEYSARKGHPRLRMRHMQFRIGVAERNWWVDTMRGALEDAGIVDPERAEMMRYFEHAATFLINDES